MPKCKLESTNTTFMHNIMDEEGLIIRKIQPMGQTPILAKVFPLALLCDKVAPPVISEYYRKQRQSKPWVFNVTPGNGCYFL